MKTFEGRIIRLKSNLKSVNRYHPPEFNPRVLGGGAGMTGEDRYDK